MALQLSTTVRNAMLDAIESGMGASAILEIRTGAPPANCGAADTGTLLVSYNLASDWAAAASAAAKALSNVPVAGTAIAAGTAGHFRFKNSGGSVCHAQGTITATGGGGDMTLDNTNIASGQAVNITGFTFTVGGA